MAKKIDDLEIPEDEKERVKKQLQEIDNRVEEVKEAFK